MTILTKWHKLKEAIQQTRFLIGDTRLDPAKLTQPWHDRVNKAVEYPKLVISPEVVKNLDPEVVSASMIAMMECNVLRLPYNPVMLEATFDDIPDEHFFLIVKDDEALLVGYRNECAQVYPVLNRMSFDFDRKSLENYVTPAFVNMPQMPEDLANFQAKHVTKIVGRLLSIAYVVTNIRGIVREEVVSERLNKKRRQAGKEPVPTYSLLRIGHVYTSTGEKLKYVQSNSPMKIHMRRGHTRHQRYGEGLSETKLIYIEPVLVNYHGGAAPEIKIKW